MAKNCYYNDQNLTSQNCQKNVCLDFEHCSYVSYGDFLVKVSSMFWIIKSLFSTQSNACIVWRRFANLFETSQSLFWASFGLVSLTDFELTGIKEFTRFWALLMFGSYSVCNIIVLLNMLIAMMSNSFQVSLSFNQCCQIFNYFYNKRPHQMAILGNFLREMQLHCSFT